jgi:signal transduction histidine kinase
LELPYVAVEVGRDDEVLTAAVHGEPQDDVMAVPLVHHHEIVGRLLVGTGPGQRLDATDRRLLGDLAAQAGAAAYSVRLTADLRLSRERLVTAREEKWRDVRHQLHDRLGPLDGILLGIGAAANTLARGDAPGTDALLGRLKAELRSEIADIRALIEQLRPRSLDELGLVGALRRQAALAALPPRPLVVQVEALDCGGLPLTVEVAAYQIVSEALTNVRRHAMARRCQVHLVVSEGWLELEVVDDGLGLLPDRAEGVGLSCMRERATELGGTFAVEPAAGGGTKVCVEIPLCNQ